MLEKTEAYEILRHPEGGRKDVFRWTTQGEKPVAELEIYRPGGEFNQTEATFAGIAARMQPAEERELEAAGVIDSKFGAVTLLRHPGTADRARACLGFIKRLDQPRLQISGWSCQGDALPARRAAIGCILNRLILLTAGKRAETGGIIRPRRAQTRQLRRISHIGRTSGLGDLCGKPPSARHALIGAPAKMLVFMQLFLPVPHYCDAVWPD